ncbi:MAG: 5'/3'-nucleotidase SurE [Bacteroidetes bacterium]|nr:5'/3'-nucleotidase SurE [Bacteroidota bacterium]
MEQERLILVTNDDGVEAKGLKSLVEIVREFGKVVVVAPEESQSGMSHAITTKFPLRVRTVKKEEGLEIYSCSGTPVDCVKLALHQLLGRKPDMLVSGINHGSNASVSIVYSGTMAAAIEGSINKINSIGFSLVDHSAEADFDAAGVYVRRIVDKVFMNGMWNGTCLNVNIPAGKENELKGIIVCRQTDGYWQEEFEKRIDPSNREYYWLTGYFSNSEPLAEDTDEWALQNKFVSVVPIQTDFTSYARVKELKKWGF